LPSSPLFECREDLSLEFFYSIEGNFLQKNAIVLESMPKTSLTREN
jgi:hypothetical protein